jgi:putative FmdB family regulatory protein
LIALAEKFMPIYEYRCGACDYHFEKIQKISDEPITLCPNCQADAAQKLISASRFKLTGSGWYETDFKQKSTTQPPQQKSGAAPKEAGDAKSSAASSDKSKTTDSKE